MAMWLQYLLFFLGLAVITSLAKDDAKNGSGLAIIVMFIGYVGMLALFFHAITGGA